MKPFVCLVLLLSLCVSAGAEVVKRTVEYKDGETVLEGFLFYDDASADKRPGVVIYHQWMGITDHELNTARRLADLGYVAFVADVYGKGDRPADRTEAGQFAGKYKTDRELFRRRVNLAFKQLKQEHRTDTDQTAAIGFCFGGTAALELARSGADTNGVVSFHGGLGTPTPEDARNIKAKVLALHGASDPFVPAEEVAAFQKEMTEANVDWHMVSYGHAVHSFTQKEAGDDPSKGAAYNADAARRSWRHMRLFFDELFTK